MTCKPSHRHSLAKSRQKGSNTICSSFLMQFEVLGAVEVLSTVDEVMAIQGRLLLPKCYRTFTSLPLQTRPSNVRRLGWHLPACYQNVTAGLRQDYDFAE